MTPILPFRSDMPKVATPPDATGSRGSNGPETHRCRGEEIRPAGHLSVVKEGDRPLNNVPVDDSLTGGGFANRCGSGGDDGLDRATHKIGRIRVSSGAGTTRPEERC